MINGFNDEFFGGLFIQISDQFTGTYTVDPTGTGRVDSFLNYTNSGPGPEFIFYLTGNGNPPLVLDVDFDGLGGGGVGAGIVYPSTVPTSFSGPYALSFAQTFFGVEGDSSGTVVVDPIANTLAGTVDTSSFFTPVHGVPLTGTFAALSNNNLTGGTLSEAFFPFNPISIQFYSLDGSYLGAREDGDPGVASGTPLLSKTPSG